MQLEKLIPVNLRQVWPHETTDFSHWLSKDENLEILGDVIGMELDIIKSELLRVNIELIYFQWINSQMRL